MLIFYNILIFIVSVFLLSFSAKCLVDSLSKIALFLRIKEFIVAFFIMAFATSLSNLSVGITSALHKIPELSFGDIIGGNIVDLSIVLGLAVLLSKDGLSCESKTVQKSSLYAIFILILPLLLVFDGKLSRGDGILLLLSFFIYIFWIFSKEERFKKNYEEALKKSLDKKEFLKCLLLFIISVIFLIVGAKGVINTALFFSQKFSIPLPLIGLLIVGLGNCLPETVFSFSAARKQENWMILGELMGSVIICATLVLGTVALIQPIKIYDFSPFAIARAFTIISILSFLFCIKTGQKITKKEGIFLISVYIFYLLSEIFVRYF